MQPQGVSYKTKLTTHETKMNNNKKRTTTTKKNHNNNFN